MTLQANAQGTLSGRFTIPGNIPSGTKSVEFSGSGGSFGQALYTGSGTIISTELQRVITIIRGTDPLAQTFTLDGARQIAAVEICFTHIGSKQVRLQIRQTQTGLPNSEVLVESALEASELNLNTPTRFDFAPVHLEAGQEYAILILTDDPDHQVAVAELGKYDQQHGWVTSQPYQVGVLLSSSNAQTWTPHQNMDLTFKLLAAKYTSSSHQIPLGSVTATNVSDLLLLAGIERNVAGVNVQVSATTDNNESYQLLEDTPLNLPQRLNSPLTLTAHLSGNEQFSPILFPGVQLAQGNLTETADYVTRAFACGDDSSLKVTFEATIPGNATVDVLAEVNGQWQTLTLAQAAITESPWQELTYSLENLTSATVRVKLVLNGNAQDRPRVRQLRAITI